MEAYFLNSSSQDHSLSLSPYKRQIKNPMTKFNHPLISHPSENFPPMNSRGGFLHAPPPPSFLSHSFPPPVTSQPHHHHHHHHLRLQQQPPLLPLPIPVQQNYVNPSSRTRGLSCPPVNRKIKNKNPTRDQSLTPRKSSKPWKPTTVVPPKEPVEKVKEIVETAINGSHGLGPDPKDLPKVLLSNNDEVIVVNQADKFSGSVVFTLVSPPPSSLPLPTFSLRAPKLSCNVEAATGIDTGATDSLRRLLRIR